MGMYINETTVMCVSPHAPGEPEDYDSETVIVGIALNGQDFNDVTSSAEVTFIGTGGSNKIFLFIISTMLIGLLLLALLMCCSALIETIRLPQKYQPKK